MARYCIHSIGHLFNHMLSSVSYFNLWRTQKFSFEEECAKKKKTFTRVSDDCDDLELLLCLRSQPRLRRDVNDRHLSLEVFQRIFDCKMVVRRMEWNGNCLFVLLTDIRFSSPEYTRQSKIRMSFSRSCETF